MSEVVGYVLLGLFLRDPRKLELAMVTDSRSVVARGGVGDGWLQ